MLKEFTSALRPAIMLTIVFALLLGLAYPAVLTGIGQLIFPDQANGSLLRNAKGDVIGSSLLAQGFASDRYFHPRPSAAGKGYDATASAGSNFGPTSKPLVDRVKADIAANQKKAPGQSVPADLVTASASGLDPHISPEAAFFQVNRVAAARHLSADTVSAQVQQHIEYPLFGFLGERRVNVLALNRALDSLASKGAQTAG